MNHAPIIRALAEPRGGRRRYWPVVLAVTALIVAAAGTGVAWVHYRTVMRIANAVPAVPDLAAKPAELRERIVRARIAALDRRTALEGVAELGRLCHANGLVPEAEACWRILIANDGGNARWGYYVADLRRLTSDDAGTLEWLRRTTRLAPAYSPAWLRLADLCFKTGQFDDAKRAYQRRLELVPHDPYARLGFARIAMQEGRRDEARKQLRQLVREAPSFSPGHNLYAELLATDGHQNQAIQERVLGRAAGRFREADDPWLDELTKWCFDYDRLCLRGTIDDQTKHGDWGKSAFERAIRLRPDDLTAYELLGSLQIEQGGVADARETLERGLRRAKDARPTARYYSDLSRVYRRLHQPTDAVRVAREGLAKTGGDAGLYEALGNALADSGDPAGAVQALVASVARNPNDAKANYDLAVALIAVHRLDDAVGQLHRSLTLEPTFPQSLALLAQIEIDSGRNREALQYLRPLFDSHPEVPAARQKMAYAYLQAGLEAETERDLAAAEKYFRSGVSIDDTSADLHVRLGVLYLIQGRFADAVAPLEAFHHLQPHNSHGALFLGQAYAALGRRDEARQVLNEGMQLAATSGDAATVQECRAALQQLQ